MDDVSTGISYKKGELTENVLSRIKSNKLMETESYGFSVCHGETFEHYLVQTNNLQFRRSHEPMSFLVIVPVLDGAIVTTDSRRILNDCCYDDAEKLFPIPSLYAVVAIAGQMTYGAQHRSFADILQSIPQTGSFPQFAAALFDVMRVMPAESATQIYVVRAAMDTALGVCATEVISICYSPELVPVGWTLLPRVLSAGQTILAGSRAAQDASRSITVGDTVAASVEPLVAHMRRIIAEDNGDGGARTVGGAIRVASIRPADVRVEAFEP